MIEPSAIVNHVTAAPAITSSGVVWPGGSLKPEAAVTGNAANAPLPPDSRPSPLAIVPSQTTSADLLIAAIGTYLLLFPSRPLTRRGPTPDDRGHRLRCHHGERPPRLGVARSLHFVLAARSGPLFCQLGSSHTDT